ncbi:hypothetical protein [Jejuia pallidilutea]|jgi:hypothetical protein|uniref:AhpC/TSA family protein n=1 Tax=Jejuia pallidilutea TaxID=504487 RepID=A0A090VVW7_9FLAO|nr:hypothetical protein [Jejuia pallidilutea]GAL68875.1 hypothetical protein JCM19301_2598 [Jejuia pallidilutea]GAL72907.1 hypothetical protein JCM19302_1756 [Jejuia pallidilutea]GAL91023.1 hypothetical protein JCM19538_1081 [Jejuia pallidilutea]
MKNHKKHIVFSGFLLMMFVLGLMFFFSIINKKEQSAQCATEIEGLRSRVLLQSRYSGLIKIPENNKLKNIKGSLQCFSIVFPESKLVLYISSNQCDSCINDAIDKVETYLKKHPEFKYVIISKGFSLRELKLMQTDRNINADIYALTNIELSFFNKMDEVHYPYYFVVNKNLEVSNIFFPIKSSSILEDRYFKQINHME